MKCIHGAELSKEGLGVRVRVALVSAVPSALRAIGISFGLSGRLGVSTVVGRVVGRILVGIADRELRRKLVPSL